MRGARGAVGGRMPNGDRTSIERGGGGAETVGGPPWWRRELAAAATATAAGRMSLALRDASWVGSSRCGRHLRTEIRLLPLKQNQTFDPTACTTIRP